MTEEREETNLEQLVRRVMLAEDVCRLYAWTGGPEETDREKALYMVWSEWYKLVGPQSCDPRRHPHLSDERIEVLARERDEIRRRTLEKLEKIVETS